MYEQVMDKKVNFIEENSTHLRNFFEISGVVQYTTLQRKHYPVYP